MSARVRTVCGLVGAQLAHDRTRTVLAVAGIALAVLATMLLSGVGYGVLVFGEERVGAAGQDIWMTGGPGGLNPAAVGGFENTIHDAHELSRAISSREDVAFAIPIGFQTVYLSEDGEDFDLIIGTGTPHGGGPLIIEEGSGFAGPDTHYADGTYEGPMTNEVVIDAVTAEQYDLSVGDTIHVGGTLSAAREHEFAVVGISPSMTAFLGAPTVTLRLSELQQVTGSTGTDPATFVVISLEDGADVTTVQAALVDEYPQYNVHTNREQLEAVLQQQATIIAGGVTLVVLAVLSGVALTVNLLAMFVAQQRRTLGVLTAIGIGRRSLVWFVVGQGLVLGVLGGTVGVVLAPVATRVLNRAAFELTGFDGIVQVPPVFYLGGFGIALGIGAVGAAVAGWKVRRLELAGTE